MNEKIHYITNEKKATKNEWENDDSDFLRALHITHSTFYLSFTFERSSQYRLFIKNNFVFRNRPLIANYFT